MRHVCDALDNAGTALYLAIGLMGGAHGNTYGEFRLPLPKELKMMKRFFEHYINFVFTRRSDAMQQACIRAAIYHDAAIKIQQAWRRCISDPNYRICDKRLRAEFEGLLSQ